MATERLYELAYRYRDAKLWKTVSESELFAVRLADGEIGYCCVLGGTGDLLALGLFPGVRGYQSWHLVIEADIPRLKTAERMMISASLDCLRCTFVNREDLTDRETAQVRHYAASHRRRLRGKNAFARFDKQIPGRVRWQLETDRDEWRLCQALEAALALGEMLRERSKEELGLCPVGAETETIPLLSRRKGAWELERTPLPEAKPTWPEVAFPDDLAAARIKRMKKSGIWECGLCRWRYPVRDQEDGDTAPWIPLMLASTDPLTQSIQPPVVSKRGDDGELLDGFARVLAQEADTPPVKIRCGDDRTYALLKDLCAKAGIELIRTDRMKELPEAIEALVQEMGKPEEEPGEDESWEAVDRLYAQMSDEEILELPAQVKAALLSIVSEGKLSEDLSRRLLRLLLVR